MANIRYLILALALAISLPAIAQTDVDVDAELGGRVAFGVDKKVMKGLHVSLEEEIRIDGNFSAFDRLQTAMGVTYKVNDIIKVGVSYALINGYSSTDSRFKMPKHRLMLDVGGGITIFNVRYSIKERLQITHRTDDFNPYQNPENLIGLKSRLKIQYKGFRRYQPYAYFELRHTLNAPVINASFDGTTYLTPSGTEKGEAGWFLEGFNGSYLDRIKSAVGVEIRLSKASSIDVHFIAEYVMEKKVDANAEGTKLKSYTQEKGFKGFLCANYVYSF